MQTLQTSSLAPYTSLRVGGPAEKLVLTDTYDETVQALQAAGDSSTILGYGSNSLISDAGLPGTTIIWRGGNITRNETLLVVDAGVWWDDLVKYAIRNNLWGLELMSEIPSSVGGAVVGNIAAYGQQVSDTLLWMDVFNREQNQVERLQKGDAYFAYRESSFQTEDSFVVLRAAFQLSKKPLHSLKYESALSVARELGSSTDTLEGLRETIIETRTRAGSIYHPEDETAEHTAGSFFKNPMVSPEQAIELAKFDETGKTLERIQQQSEIHGGSSLRASAAHALLAAGFSRGQTWDKVRLHPKHVLKIETLEGATASEVYAVANEIIDTVKDKLNITLIPEVRFLGKF